MCIFKYRRKIRTLVISRTYHYCYIMQNNLNITAHSGCDDTAGNSLESIDSGIAFGADAVEVDVRFTGKGELILSHDKDPQGEYKDHPSLAKAFDRVIQSGRIAINCDIKENETIPALLELAAKKGIGPDRLVLTGSVTPLVLKENPAILKQAQVWLNIEECLYHFCQTGDEAVKPFQYLVMGGMNADTLLTAMAPHSAPLMEAIISGCQSWGVQVLNMPYVEFTVAHIPEIKKRGLAVSLWTINKEEALKRLFGLGVLNVTTRNTRLAVKTRKDFE